MLDAGALCRSRSGLPSEMLIAIQISMRGSFIAFGHWAAREIGTEAFP